MPRSLLGVLTLLELTTCGPANAQTARILSTNPAADAVGVALEATVTFGFDREVARARVAPGRRTNHNLDRCRIR
jgi:hypothetical protein